MDKVQFFMGTQENLDKIRIEDVLAKVRPFINRDGGDVELVSFTNGVCTVKFTGACIGCDMLEDSTVAGLQELLMEEVPSVIRVNVQV